MKGISKHIEFKKDHGMYELIHSSFVVRRKDYNSKPNTYLIPQKDIDNLVHGNISILSEVYRITSMKENGNLNTVRLLEKKHILPQITAAVYVAETISITLSIDFKPIEQLISTEELNGFRTIGKETINENEF